MDRKFRFYLVNDEYMVHGTNDDKVALAAKDMSPEGGIMAVIDTQTNTDLSVGQEITEQQFIILG